MIYLYLGDRKKDIENNIKKLKDFFIDKYGNKNIYSFNFPEDIKNKEEILNVYKNLSLFSNNKFIILKNLFQLDKENLKVISDLLKNNIENKNIFTIIYENNIDKRNGFFKFLSKEKNCLIKEMNFDQDVEIDKWILKKIQENKLKIDKNNFDYLIKKLNIKRNYRNELEGNKDSLKIEHELNKLFNFCEIEITKEKIDEIINKEKDNDIFYLINLIFDKDKNFYKKFEGYFQNDIKNEAGEKIRFNLLMFNQIKDYIFLKKLLDSKMKDEEICKLLNWKSGRLYIMRKKLYNLSNDNINFLEKNILELDKLLKSDNTLFIPKFTNIINQIIYS
jgi:DNA polymerase III delta subunit